MENQNIKGDTFDLALAAEGISERPQCQEKGCDKAGISCEIDVGEIDAYYCPEHAVENGFCACCGTFIAGIRCFADLCENCEIELREPDNEDDESDDDYWDEEPF